MKFERALAIITLVLPWYVWTTVSIFKIRTDVAVIKTILKAESSQVSDR